MPRHHRPHGTMGRRPFMMWTERPRCFLHNHLGKERWRRYTHVDRVSGKHSSLLVQWRLHTSYGRSFSSSMLWLLPCFFLGLQPHQCVLHGLILGVLGTRHFFVFVSPNDRRRGWPPTQLQSAGTSNCCSSSAPSFIFRPIAYIHLPSASIASS